MKPVIVGVSGRKRTGKDTACERFVEFGSYMGLMVRRFAFADALKEEVAKACGVTVEFIEEHKAEFRPILQWWGTDFRRRFFGDDYWIRRMEQKLEDTECCVAIVTDVRFPNEAEAIQAWGGVLLRVNRKAVYDGDAHASEAALDGWDRWDDVIHNDESLDEYAINLLQFWTVYVVGRTKRKDTNEDETKVGAPDQQGAGKGDDRIPEAAD